MTQARAAGVTRPGAGIALAPGRLARLRHSKLLTREDLARRTAELDRDGTGISLSEVTKIENGQRRPRTATLGLLCEALGCRPSDLMLGEHPFAAPRGSTAYCKRCGYTRDAGQHPT
jgi:transcriptional regulator with XRE-family HTH domain